eukprot:m.95600 g.95600  ORF g.95600 m.95600 type:complete len:76 (+) comp13060_c0_seq7:71-298(+)
MAAEQYTEQLLLHRLVFENDVDALGVAIASQTVRTSHRETHYKEVHAYFQLTPIELRECISINFNGNKMECCVVL